MSQKSFNQYPLYFSSLRFSTQQEIRACQDDIKAYTSFQTASAKQLSHLFSPKKSLSINELMESITQIFLIVKQPPSII